MGQNRSIIMLTRKHFADLAERIGKADPPWTRDQITLIEEFCAASNSRFDCDRFQSAVREHRRRLEEHATSMAWSARCDCRNDHHSSSGRCTCRRDGGEDGVTDPTRRRGEVAICSHCREHCRQ
jgi:hypothetical protein